MTRLATLRNAFPGPELTKSCLGAAAPYLLVTLYLFGAGHAVWGLESGVCLAHLIHNVTTTIGTDPSCPVPGAHFIINRPKT